jgi:hypothetical protein
VWPQIWSKRFIEKEELLALAGVETPFYEIKIRYKDSAHILLPFIFPLSW